MSGKSATLLDPADSTTPNVRGSHGMPLPQWRVQNGSSPAFPHIQAFSEGNGNEQYDPLSVSIPNDACFANCPRLFFSKF